MVCFTRLSQFVANEVRRQVDEEGFRCPDGNSRILFRCAAEGNEPDFDTVELIHQYDKTYVKTYTRVRMDDGNFTTHNTSEHVIHDESKVAELLQQCLDAFQERVVKFDYAPPTFNMQTERTVRCDGDLTVDIHKIELDLD